MACCQTGGGKRGDPYQWQVERTAAGALVDVLGIGMSWRVCYQSRVGPLKWLEPSTESRKSAAPCAAEGKGVIVAPIAFVSEHSETLVELDIEYGQSLRGRPASRIIAAPPAGRRRPGIHRRPGGIGAQGCGRGRHCQRRGPASVSGRNSAGVLGAQAWEEM